MLDFKQLKKLNSLIMKNFKIILLAIIGILSMSCDLEDPIFLDSQAVYTDINVAKGALDGIYHGLTSYGAQEQRLFALAGYSGLFVTGKNGGNNVNNAVSYTHLTLPTNREV